MKILIILLLSIFIFTSCSYDDDSCKYPSGVTIPEGHTFNSLSELTGNRIFKDFQMVSPTVGYVGGYDVTIANGTLFKTEDGGGNWEAIPLTDVSSIYGLAFKDENLGYISHKSEEDDIPHFEKTINGGLDWEEIEIVDFFDPLRQLKIDSNGNAFGVRLFYTDSLGLGIDPVFDSLHIMKYDEQESLWSDIYSSTNIELSLIDIIDDKLFVEEYSRVTVIDTNGNIEKTYRGLSANQIKIVDADNICVSDHFGVQKTSNGGNGYDDWSEMYSGQGFLLDYTVEDGALMFLNTTDKYCVYPLEKLTSFATADFNSSLINDSPPMTTMPFKLIFLHKT